MLGQHSIGPALNLIAALGKEVADLLTRAEALRNQAQDQIKALEEENKKLREQADNVVSG